MFIHVRLLEAKLGPCSSRVVRMLSQERRVPYKNSNFDSILKDALEICCGRAFFPPRSGFSWVSSVPSQRNL